MLLSNPLCFSMLRTKPLAVSGALESDLQVAFALCESKREGEREERERARASTGLVLPCTLRVCEQYERGREKRGIESTHMHVCV